jgi:hypothetical protein
MGWRAARFAFHPIGNTGAMRRRALLLALVAGGLTAGASVALAVPRVLDRDVVARTAALARADLADVPAPSALARARDGIERGHEVHRDVAAVLTVVLAALLAGGWHLARSRVAAMRRSLALATRQPRAPPRMPRPVHC